MPEKCNILRGNLLAKKQSLKKKCGSNSSDRPGIVSVTLLQQKKNNSKATGFCANHEGREDVYIITRSHKFLWLSIALMSIVLSPAYGDDFNLENFSRPPSSGNDFFGPNAGVIEGSCNVGDDCAGNDGTVFSQEQVNIKGIRYWRNVVGEEATGFAIEYYTRIGGTASSDRGFSPDTGGHENSLHNGLYGGDICQNVPQNSSGNFCGNATDPLGVYTYSGTGTGDPSKIAMRMVIDDGSGMSLEVYKPLLGFKHKITQTIIDGDLRNEFIIDMTGISFTDKNTPAPIINNQAIDDPDMPTPGAGDFSMLMVDQSDVTAGRYTFTPGTGWNNPDVGWRDPNSSYGQGSYDYIDGGFDVLNIDWASYFNYAENAVACNTGTRSIAQTCPGAP